MAPGDETRTRTSVILYYISVKDRDSWLSKAGLVKIERKHWEDGNWTGDRARPAAGRSHR